MGLMDWLKRIFSVGSANGFRDRKMRCVQCRNEFVFEAGEQAFFQERGFQEPKRCPTCRKKHKFGGRRRRR